MATLVETNDHIGAESLPFASLNNEEIVSFLSYDFEERLNNPYHDLGKDLIFLYS